MSNFSSGTYRVSILPEIDGGSGGLFDTLLVSTTGIGVEISMERSHQPDAHECFDCDWDFRVTIIGDGEKFAGIDESVTFNCFSKALTFYAEMLKLWSKV